MANCKVCGSGPVAEIWLGWMRCTICGSDSGPTEYDRSLYGANFPEALSDHRVHGKLDDDGLRRDMSTNTDWILRLPVPAISVLDAGCAWGVSQQVFTSRGWRWHGWDVERYARASDAVIVADEFRASMLPSPVGAVMLREVIEHVPDAKRLLRELHAATLPGGWIQVQTPRPTERIDQILYHPQHLRLYSPEALAGLLWECGWVVRERLEWEIGQCVAARRI